MHMVVNVAIVTLLMWQLAPTTQKVVNVTHLHYETLETVPYVMANDT